MSKIPAVLLGLIATASLVGNVLLYQRYSSSRPIMRIGSDAITIKEYRDALDNEFGKTVLNRMAYADIVQQAAKAAGITPTDKDVDERIAETERRTPEALEAAKHDPAVMQRLRSDIASDIALENLSIKDVKVSNKEVESFYRDNKALFGLPRQISTTLVQARNAADAATAAALLRDSTIKLDVIANQPRLTVLGTGGRDAQISLLPPAIQNRLSGAIWRTPAHGVVTVELTPDLFIAARVESVAKDQVQPLPAIRPTVERIIKLKKAPPRNVVLARLYKKANPQFEISKYEAFFSDVKTMAD